MSIEVTHNGKRFYCMVDADSTGLMVQVMSMCHEKHAASEARTAEQKACEIYRNRNI